MLLLILAVGASRTFTGAWIETCEYRLLQLVGDVAPLQVRGLKLDSTAYRNPKRRSHLYRCVD